MTTHSLPEIVRRLRVTRATISHSSAGHRLRLSRALFPVLDLRDEQRRLYLYAVGDYLEVASVAFFKEGLTRNPLGPQEL